MKSSMSSKKFEMTTDHLTLLTQFNIDWDPCEAGAPCVDPKRPYGNGDVEADVCKLLKWTMEGDDGHERCWSAKQRQAALNIHRSMEAALQIVLCLGKFEEGWYEKVDYRTWVKM